MRKLQAKSDWKYARKKKEWDDRPIFFHVVAILPETMCKTEKVNSLTNFRLLIAIPVYSKGQHTCKPIGHYTFLAGRKYISYTINCNHKQLANAFWKNWIFHIFAHIFWQSSHNVYQLILSRISIFEHIFKYLLANFHTFFHPFYELWAFSVLG